MKPEKERRACGAHILANVGGAIEKQQRVNINTASAEELEQIAHVGEARAAEIIRLCPFTSLDNLERVPGIGPARVADIKTEGIAYVE